VLGLRMGAADPAGLYRPRHPAHNHQRVRKAQLPGSICTVTAHDSDIEYLRREIDCVRQAIQTLPAEGADRRELTERLLSRLCELERIADETPTEGVAKRKGRRRTRL